jgi:hypothetical protein
LPHHFVLKPDSSTTKLRVVFDGSAKSSSGISLNDLLLIGPVVQDELFSIFLRFRTYRYVMTADIQQMYRQILIQREHQGLQQIKWRTDSNSSTKSYKLATVTYGTAAAPYLATKVLVQLAEDEKASYPLASKAIKNFYVDDFLGGSQNLYELLETQNQLIKMLKFAGMKLRKWCANHKKLLEKIPLDDREIPTTIENSAHNDTIKTLGTLWNHQADTLQYKIRLNNLRSSEITERNILSIVSSIYDPLGMLGPIIVRAKIFLQKLWLLKLHWDEILPDAEKYEWNI